MNYQEFAEQIKPDYTLKRPQANVLTIARTDHPSRIVFRLTVDETVSLKLAVMTLPQIDLYRFTTFAHQPITDIFAADFDEPISVNFTRNQLTSLQKAIQTQYNVDANWADIKEAPLEHDLALDGANASIQKAIKHYDQPKSSTNDEHVGSNRDKVEPDVDDWLSAIGYKHADDPKLLDYDGWGPRDIDSIRHYLKQQVKNADTVQSCVPKDDNDSVNQPEHDTDWVKNWQQQMLDDWQQVKNNSSDRKLLEYYSHQYLPVVVKPIGDNDGKLRYLPVLVPCEIDHDKRDSESKSE